MYTSSNDMESDYQFVYLQNNLNHPPLKKMAAILADDIFKCIVLN